MEILIPMAGEGKRFVECGYKDPKPIIPLVYRKNGLTMPMYIASTMDLPGVSDGNSSITFIVREDLKDQIEGTVRSVFPAAKEYVINHLTEGQACTCLEAIGCIDLEDELIIAACDNGIDYCKESFVRLKDKSDAIVFTFSGDPVVLDNPRAFGWMLADENGRVLDVSVKTPISDNPLMDHAVVGTFWFKKGSSFLEGAKKMIRENDRINGEFYVDQVFRHMIEMGCDVRIFDVERFMNYGTPETYENYHKNITYFREFIKSDYCMED